MGTVHLCGKALTALGSARSTLADSWPRSTLALELDEALAMRPVKHSIPRLITFSSQVLFQCVFFCESVSILHTICMPRWRLTDPKTAQFFWRQYSALVLRATIVLTVAFLLPMAAFTLASFQPQYIGLSN